MFVLNRLMARLGGRRPRSARFTRLHAAASGRVKGLRLRTFEIRGVCSSAFFSEAAALRSTVVLCSCHTRHMWIFGGEATSPSKRLRAPPQTLMPSRKSYFRCE